MGVRVPDGAARGWWGANPSSSRGSAGDAARDGQRPLHAHRDDDDDRGELSSGGESDDSRATVVTHGAVAHHRVSLSGVSSSGGDLASASDVERGDVDFARGRGATLQSRFAGVPGGSARPSDAARLAGAGGGSKVSPQSLQSLRSFGGAATPADSDVVSSPLRRVDSETHVVEALASVPGLHKRGIDLPMTKRRAFRKCRSVARNRGLLALLLTLFVVAATARARRGAAPAPAFLPARRLEQPGLAFEDADAASDDTARRGLLGDEVRTRFGAGRGAGRRAARRAKPSSVEKEEAHTDARRRVS